MRNYLILGASKGLGDAFVKGLPEYGDQYGSSPEADRAVWILMMAYSGYGLQ